MGLSKKAALHHERNTSTSGIAMVPPDLIVGPKNLDQPQAFSRVGPGFLKTQHIRFTTELPDFELLVRGEPAVHIRDDRINIPRDQLNGPCVRPVIYEALVSIGGWGRSRRGTRNVLLELDQLGKLDRPPKVALPIKNLAALIITALSHFVVRDCGIVFRLASIIHKCKSAPERVDI